MAGLQHRSADDRRWLMAAILPAGLFAGLVWGLNEHALPWAWSWAWVPGIELDLAFRIDALSAQMLALIPVRYQRRMDKLYMTL